MRWRMCIFFLAVTAAFCFMLLTAVTDYGSSNYHPVLTATRDAAPSGMLSATTRVEDTPDNAAAARETLVKFDPMLRPETPKLFVPHNADPVKERLDKDQMLREKRGKLPLSKRMRLDEHGWHREETALVTAYCPCAKCCGTQSPGITSIGKTAWKPGLAADPIYLHYGTEVFVPGYGMSVIDDTGGAMRRHWRRDGMLHIDVRMTYHYEARKWGKRYLRVKIYESE